MTPAQKFCPKCGDSCSPGVKFCGSCGYRFEGKSAGEVVREAQEKVQMVESAVRTAESAVNTISKARELVITPPAEWKVVIGDTLPEAVEKRVAGAVQARATDLIAEKTTEALGKVVSSIGKNIETSPPAGPGQFQGPAAGRCGSCGAVVKTGAKYCGSCGAPVKTSREATPPQSRCPSCGAPVKAGAKFCGSCGARIP